MLADGGNVVAEFARDEGTRVLDTAVEVNRGQQRLVRVGEQRLLAAAARLLFPAAEEQVPAEVQLLGAAGERGGRDELRLGL